MSRILLTLTLATLAFAPLSAQAKDKGKPVDPGKRVCRRELPTGKLIATTTCHTAGEWAQIDGANEAAGKNLLDGMRRNGLGATGR